MSVQSIISILDKLEKMHKSLLEHAYKKTELVKKGDMQELDNMLKIEQSHVAAIETLEQQRQKIVTDYFRAKGIAHSDIPTVADVIEAASKEEERQQLQAVRDRLMETIEELKRQNDLNQKLVFQSLQFVNMSLDLMRPRPQENTMNYSSKEVRGTNNAAKKAFFDSQA